MKNEKEILENVIRERNIARAGLAAANGEIQGMEKVLASKNSKALSRALILNAASRFMADPQRSMTTQDVLSTAQKWAQWAESE
jgi:flagellar hook-associated protein FlgK